MLTHSLIYVLYTRVEVKLLLKSKRIALLYEYRIIVIKLGTFTALR